MDNTFCIFVETQMTEWNANRETRVLYCVKFYEECTFEWTLSKGCYLSLRFEIFHQFSRVCSVLITAMKRGNLPRETELINLVNSYDTKEV